MKKQPSTHPPRTLGIMLAIGLSGLLYGITPLLFVFFVRTNQIRQAQLGTLGGIGGQDNLLGMGVFAVTHAELWLWGVPAGIYLVILIFGWIGKPPQVRLVIAWGALALLLWSIALILYRLQMNRILRQEVGAFWSDGLFTPALTCSFLYGLLITLYTLWYMNRGPARAFYRGYYLKSVDEESTSSPTQ